MKSAESSSGTLWRWVSVGASLVGILAFSWPLWVSLVPWPQAVLGPAAVMTTPVVVVVVLLSSETQLRNPRVLAMVGVLAALAAAARLLSAGIGGIEFVFVMVILAGRVLGARLGFVVGALALAVSSLMWGGFGPWSAFQMLAVGFVGAVAGLLPRWTGQPRVELGMLMVYGAAASYVFGLLMNLWFWPVVLGSGTTLSLVEGAGFGENAASFFLYSLATSTLTWDTVRAITTVVTLGVIGIPALTATKTLVNSLGWGNAKRRCFLVVKRTISPQIGAFLFQVHVVSNNLFNSGCFKNLCYGFLRNQRELKVIQLSLKISLKF